MWFYEKWNCLKLFNGLTIFWKYSCDKGDGHLFAFCLKYCLLSAPADSQAWNHYVLSQWIQMILQVRYRMNGFCKKISLLYATYREKASVTKVYEQKRKSQWASKVLQI